jgi:hypothetical protein
MDLKANARFVSGNITAIIEAASRDITKAIETGYCSGKKNGVKIIEKAYHGGRMDGVKIIETK